MSIGPTAQLRPSTEPQVDQGEVRSGNATAIPLPGSGSTGEQQPPQNAPSVASVPQDVVKVQLEPPGEIVVYQFVDHQGTVVLQVPPRQLLDLAQQISQELKRQAAPQAQAGTAGGKSNGR
jgi:hypothetical protein